MEKERWISREEAVKMITDRLHAPGFMEETFDLLEKAEKGPPLSLLKLERLRTKGGMQGNIIADAYLQKRPVRRFLHNLVHGTRVKYGQMRWKLMQRRYGTEEARRRIRAKRELKIS